MANRLQALSDRFNLLPPLLPRWVTQEKEGISVWFGRHFEGAALDVLLDDRQRQAASDQIQGRRQESMEAGI